MEATVTFLNGTTKSARNCILTGDRDSIILGELTITDFYYAYNAPMKGVSADMKLTDATSDDAVSIKVELFTVEEGAYQLLQTNTANLEKFNAASIFTSPFDIYGTRNYVGSSWANERQTEYGQHVIPTRVLATVTLKNGKVLTAERLILTGDRDQIVPSVVAEDFTYGAWSGIKGVNAGFHTVNFDLGQAVDVKVELFSGADGDVLMQTDTWIKENTAWAGMQQYSAPFDIFGTFDYVADGYWTNARETEYGQTAIPTRVLTTITLPGDVVVTAENTNLTGDRRWIVSTLDEEIRTAKEYEYTPPYVYVGDISFDDTTNTYHGIYTPAQFFDKRATFDLARLLGALHRQEGSTVQSITFNEKVYTWKFDPPEHPELKGSNWRKIDDSSITLVRVVSDMVIAGEIEENEIFSMVLSDGYNTETVRFKFTVTNTLDAEIGSGFDYEYSDEYEYVGAREFDDPNNIYTVTYPETQVNPHAMYDLARYLGALHRQEDATVIQISYNGVNYTWDAEGTLAGSNWKDADGNTLVSVVVAAFNSGTLDPDAGLTLVLSDGVHTENVTFKMVINNVAPVADDDAYETDEDVTLTVAKADGVLKNDTDVSPLTAVLVEGPANGTLTLNADGSFEYVPNADWNGTDTFTYKANDGELDSNVATVTITVKPVNDAPVAEDQAVTTDEDTAVEITLVATDVDGDTLTYAIVTAPTNGTITIVDNVVTYTPNANWHGADSFTFKANDGTVDSNIATVTITVKDVKDDVVANDDAYSVIQGKVLTVAAPGVLANDEDIDENNMSALLKTPPTNGTVVLLGDGSFVYTPNPEFSGEDTFVYTLKTSPGITGTGAWQADATVTITVYGKPVISSDDIEGPYYVGYEQEYHMKLANPAGGKTYNPVQVEIFAGNIVLDDIETIKVEHPAQAGEWIDLKPLVVADAGGLRLVTPIVPLPIEPDNDYTLTFLVEFNKEGTYPVTGTLYYYPNSDGTDHGDPVAVADFSSEMVVLKDIPVAVDDAYETDEDVTLTVAAADGVLKNDTLNAPGTLTAVLLETVDVAHGTLTFAADGSFEFVPFANWYGTATFTYKATDGKHESAPATVTIVVKDVKDPVQAVDDAYETNEDTELNVSALEGVLANDIDVDLNNQYAYIKSNPTHGTVDLNPNGSFVYTPDADFHGEDVFEYTLVTTPRINDDWVDSAKVTITVKPVNDAPVLDPVTDAEIPVNVAYTFTATGSDVDGDTLTFSLKNAPAGATIDESTGVFTWTPGWDDLGANTFQVCVSDGELEDCKEITLTVLNVNTLDEEIRTAKEYTYTPPYVYVGDITFDDAENLYHGTYTPKQFFDKRATFDLARYLGALHRQATSTVQKITFEGVEYTWQEVEPILKGSNWRKNDDSTITLVRVVSDMVIAGEIEENEIFSMVLSDGHNTETVRFKFTVTNTLDAEIGSGFDYEYSDEYEYVGAREFDDPNNIYTVTYPETQVNPHAMYDLARYLGALYRQDGATVSSIEYKGVKYTWNAEGTLLGSNWEDDEGNTLVSVITADFLSGAIDPAVGIVLTVSDGIHTETVTFKMVINNVAPVAVDDAYTTDEDTVLTVAKADGVLKNDTDVSPLTAELVEGPANGTLTLNADGSFVYKPNANFNGTDTFTYKAFDDELYSEVATVTITVKPVNDAPVAEDQAVTTDEDTAVEITLVATDVDGDALTYSIVDQPAHGNVALVGDVVTYTPAENFNGTDSFTFKANDGTADSNIATVTITVTDVKDQVQAVDDFYTMDEDAILTVAAPGVLENDIDVDNNVQKTFVTIPPSHGTVSMGQDGSFVYTPEANYNGTDTFEYILQTSPRTNDLWSDTATVTITINAINDAPVLEPIADVTIPEMEAYTFTAVATDVDAGDTLTFSLVGAPDGAAIDASTGVFTWTPTEEQGPDEYTFTVKVCDDADPALCDEQELKLTVTEVNVAPVLANINNRIVNEQNLLTINVSATDADVPAQALSFSLVGEAHGATLNEATGKFTWTPTEAQGPGTFSFTVKVCDNGTPVLCDQKTFEVDVKEVNIPPVLAEIGDKTVVATEELTFTATATDEDIPVQTLTFSLKDAPVGAEIDATTGVFTWTPTAAQVGDHTFKVCVSDGVAEVCEEITVTVEESVVVNLPPVAVADAYETNEDVALIIAAPGVLENDSDPNGDAITAILVSEPEHGTLALAANGGFVYSPNADWNGTDTFTYKASDGTLESEDATVTITVNPVNDAPVAVDDAYTVAEDTLLSIAAPGVLANDYDVDGDVLNATVRTNPSHGTLSFTSDGSFTYMPDPDWHGTDSFTYNLITHPAPTSGWTDWATVTITVTPVNDAPVLDPIADATIPEMVAYTFTATATDVDSTNLTFSLVNAPAGATINASTGVFTWTPTEAQGPNVFTFTVKVCDDATPALCDQQDVTLSVLEVNRAPEIEDIEDQEVTVGEELTFTAVASDPDLPANTLTFRLEEAPAGAAIDPTTGKFTWTPVESQIGEHEFYVCVTDGQLNTCTLVKVTVKQGHVNTPPVAVADTYAVDQDQVLTIAAPGVLANDTDADNDTLTAILVSTTSKGTLALKADGSFVYTPQAGFFGTDTFTYKANDGEADSNVVTVTITVRKAEPVMPYGMYYPVVFKGW